MLCILYVNAVGVLLGIAGQLIESILPASTTRRRMVWCATIASSFVIPPIYRAKHTSAVEWQGSSVLNGFISDGWSIASAMLVIWGIATAVRIAVLLHRSRHGSGGARQIDGVAVVVTDSVGPATVGVLKSKVVVPRWVLALPGPQRSYVLRHEEEHRRSHDSLLLFVASLALIATPWNLAMWWQLRRLRLAVEMDCDNRVVSALGDAPAYGELLFRVAEASNRGPRFQPAFLGAGMLETRLQALVAPKPTNRRSRLMLAGLACVLLFIAVVAPHPVSGSQHNVVAHQTSHNID